MSKRAVIVGGFTTGRRLLEPVADAICSRFGFTDADVFQFTDCIEDTTNLQRALEGQTAYPISAGMLAVSQCTGMERVVALNAPEPTGIVRLMANAAIKSCNLWEAAVTGPHRKGVSRVIATNAIQMTAYPVAHGRQIAAVSRFSAQEQLELMEKAGLPTARVDTDRDEFFGPYSIQPWDGRRVVLPGCHDQVIIDPVGFIADMPEQVLAR